MKRGEEGKGGGLGYVLEGKGEAKKGRREEEIGGGGEGGRGAKKASLKM